MAHEKQFTPRQAALSVLEKVTEVLQKSEMAKGYEGFKAVEASAAKSGASDPAAVAAAVGRKKYGKEAFQNAAAKGKKMHKAGVEDAQIESKEESKIFEKAEGYKPENSKKENAKPSEHNSKDAMQNADGPGPKGEIHPKEKDAGAPTNKIQEQKDPQHNPKEEAEGNNELAGTTPTQVGKDGKAVPGGDEIKGHLKLAKFIGRMDYKRSTKQDQQKVAAQQHVGNSQTESTAQHKQSVGKLPG